VAGQPDGRLDEQQSRLEWRTSRGVSETEQQPLGSFVCLDRGPTLNQTVEQSEPRATLLDIAAASGATNLWMQDLRFKVPATDCVRENVRRPPVAFAEADPDDRLSSAFSRRHQASITSEIIEHLESPRHFARECFDLL
jgi:2-polyprenyl-3-methyl-5-hydroxy-6-metoxy-1,4-benzoquinol methylase